MADPRWEEVYARPIAGGMPAVSRRDLPFVRDPVCPQHCSGKHDTEAVLGCVDCRVRLYRVVAHEWYFNEGHYFYSHEPIHEAPVGLTACPTCGGPLRRLP